MNKNDWANAKKLVEEMQEQRKNFIIELKHVDQEKPIQDGDYFLAGIEKKQFVLMKTDMLEFPSLNEKLKVPFIDRNTSIMLYIERNDVESEIYRILQDKTSWQHCEEYYDALDQITLYMIAIDAVEKMMKGEIQ